MNIEVLKSMFVKTMFVKTMLVKTTEREPPR